MKIVYACDPAKAVNCRKTICFLHGGECHRTLDASIAAQNLDGSPIIEDYRLDPTEDHDLIKKILDEFGKANLYGHKEETENEQ